MRRALCVGINHYPKAELKGCINDANAMTNAIEKHHDGKQNFHVKKLTSDKYRITKAQLMRGIIELFEKPADVALFYFSGHGVHAELGGYLVVEDSQQYDLGIPLNEVLELANMAKHIKEIIIVIDACNSGIAGNTDPLNNDIAIIRKGVSVLASSLQNEYSYEKDGQGVFTSTIVEALNGGGADIMGQVTVAGVYNYADKVLGPWQQRPVFKSHVTELSVLKYTRPQISFEDLRLLDDYFKTPDYAYPLSPAYEPRAKPKDKVKQKIFGFLQECRACNLVEPIGEKHMYDAAMNSGHCQLTARGRLYWKMVQLNKI